MKIGAMYSHLNGFEWIQYHQKEMWEEMTSIIENINAEVFRTKISKEKTKTLEKNSSASLLLSNCYEID